MDRGLFRQVALDRLSSPERLDSLMRVATPRAWAALVGLAVVVAAALAWGFFGSAPDTVDGSGILVRQGGLLALEAKAAGIVRDLGVRVGDTVARGQRLARVSQPELEQSLRQARRRVAELSANRDLSTGLLHRSRELDVASTEQQVRQLTQSMEATRARIRYLEQRVRAQEEIYRLGLITKDTWQATVQDLAGARDLLAGAEVQIKQLSARLVSLQTQTRQSLFSLEKETQDAQRQVELLAAQLSETATVESGSEGRVVEVLTSEGALVRQGQALFTVESLSAAIRGELFVSSEARRIRPGQRVRVTPAGVAPEEYGYMIGRVAAVSESPLSATAMNVLLRNDLLVQQFTTRGGVYRVGVELELDPARPSGFRWTTRRGPPIVFGSGTLFAGRVEVRQQRPISLMIPALRKWLGA